MLYISAVWICNILFTHSSIDGNWGWFYSGAIMNNATMHTHVQAFVWLYVFNSLGYIVRSKIVGSYDNSIFYLLRTCWIVFQSDCTILHSHAMCGGSSFPISLPTFVYSFFWLQLSWWVLSGMSLWLWSPFPKTKDAEHLSMCLLAICMSSLDKCLFVFFAHF